MKIWGTILIGLILWGLFFLPVCAEGGEIEEDTVWSEDKIIDGVVKVEKGVELKVEPGVKVEFRQGGNLNVSGDLIIEGEKENPVVFWREKPVGDIDEEELWAYYLFFGPDSNSKIKGLILRNGGGHFKGGTSMPAIRVKGKLEIYDSLLTENTWATDVMDEGYLKMRNCEIYDNRDTWGVKVIDNSARADVIDNYWGDDSGPWYDFGNDEGKGERIFGKNVEFDPWQKKGQRPVILVPGFGESLNFRKFLKDQEGGKWWLFPSKKNTTGLKKMFQEAGFEEGKDLFVAYYDWREPLEKSFEEYLRPVIQQARQAKDFWEVDVIGYSFGGLVARRYIQAENYNFDVNNLITVGTPHKGVSKIYTFAEGGLLPEDWSPLLYLYLWFDQAKTDVVLIDYLQERFSSVYELFPNYDFLKNKETGELVDFREMLFFNKTLDDLNKEAEMLKDWAEVHFIGGTGKETIDEIPVMASSLPNGEPKLGFWRDGIPDPFFPVADSTEGDGTVLTKSANWELEGFGSTILEAGHADLPGVAGGVIGMMLGVELNNDSFGEEENLKRWSNYLMIAFEEGVKVEIINSAEEKLTGEINEIEGAYFFGEDLGDEAIAVLYEPEESYEIRLTGTKDCEYRILALDWKGREAGKAEVAGAINQGEEVVYVLKRDEEDEKKIEFQEKIDSSYKTLARKIKGFYEQREIKSWKIRQELLGKVLTGYDFLKKEKKEDERLVLEELREKIGEFKGNDLISERGASSLKEALEKLLDKL